MKIKSILVISFQSASMYKSVSSQWISERSVSKANQEEISKKSLLSKKYPNQTEILARIDR